jgi:carboxyl-terminal processing protease
MAVARVALVAALLLTAPVLLLNSADAVTSDTQSAEVSASTKVAGTLALKADDNMMFMTRFHYRPKPLDAAFSSEVFDRLVEDLDPQRTYFTQADVSHFSPLRPILGVAVDTGNLEPAFEPINLYLNRVLEGARYSQSLLAAGFDFSANESEMIDRKAQPWPQSEDELHELWRQHTKDDWLRLKLAGKDDAGIRETLSRRYKNLESRVGKTSSEDVLQLFMTAYAQSTDPHTDYFAAKAASQFNTAMSLSLDGIGAYLRAHDEYTVVTELVAGSPADKSGQVHIGDRLTGVGQGGSGPLTDVVGWRTDDVAALVRGKAGTAVRLELMPDERKGDAAPMTVTLTRRRVTMDDQAAKQTVIDLGTPGHPRRIGVITVPSFYEDFDGKSKGDPHYRSVTRDVSSMLSALSSSKVDGVVIDMRNNGGGSLTEAAGMVGLFTGSGPVVQVRSANGDVDVQRSAASAPVWRGPVAVLVNRGSASASEIFAAALQDRGRALIVGEQTFGKGTVQNLVDLGDALGRGSDGKLGELKMTIAQFYRVNGVSTQLKGVLPDVVYPDTPDDLDLGESMYKNALPASSIAAAQYVRDDREVPHLAALVRSHQDRVAASADWQLQQEQASAYAAMAKRTSVSLNLSERKAVRDADIKRIAGFAARRKALALAEGRPADGDDAPTADDGLVPTERAVDTQRLGATKVSTDAYVRETAQIVEDDAALLMSVAGGHV